MSMQPFLLLFSLTTARNELKDYKFEEKKTQSYASYFNMSLNPILTKPHSEARVARRPIIDRYT